MSKTILTVCLLCVCSMQVFALGGGGGPIGMAFVASDSSLLNEHVTSFNIPAFEDTTYMIGGTGVNWITNNFGIGGMITAGSQMTHLADRYASLTLVNANLPLQNIFHEGRRAQYTFMYGPGFSYSRLSVDDGTDIYAYEVSSLMFFVAFTAQLKLTEMLRIEVQLGSNSTNGQSEWRQASGPEDAGVPGNGNLSGMYGAVALKFGGRFNQTQDGMYLTAR